jgi:hypothetical protein
MKTETKNSYPTQAEINAYIAEAHRLRGECFAKMISSTIRGITGLFSSPGARSITRPINTPS